MWARRREQLERVCRYILRRPWPCSDSRRARVGSSCITLAGPGATAPRRCSSAGALGCPRAAPAPTSVGLPWAPRPGRSRWRSAIVPTPSPPDSPGRRRHARSEPLALGSATPAGVRLDVLVCDRCGGPRRIFGAVTDPCGAAALGRARPGRRADAPPRTDPRAIAPTTGAAVPVCSRTRRRGFRASSHRPPVALSGPSAARYTPPTGVTRRPTVMTRRLGGHQAVSRGQERALSLRSPTPARRGGARPRRGQEYGRHGAQGQRDSASPGPADLLADVPAGPLGRDRRSRLLHHRGLDVSRADHLLRALRDRSPEPAGSRGGLALDAFVAHYHRERNHQELGNALITPAAAGAGGIQVRCRDRLGGLLRYYYCAA
jgi:hypothetical protein